MRRIKQALMCCLAPVRTEEMPILWPFSISVVYSVINVVVAGKRMCLKFKASFLQYESQQLFQVYWDVCRVTFASKLNLSSFHLGMKQSQDIPVYITLAVIVVFCGWQVTRLVQLMMVPVAAMCITTNANRLQLYKNCLIGDLPASKHTLQDPRRGG